VDHGAAAFRRADEHDQELANVHRAIVLLQSLLADHASTKDKALGTTPALLRILRPRRRPRRVPSRGGVTTLRGIDAVLEWYAAGGVADEGAPEDLGGAESVDVSEERGELEDFGEGRVGSLNRLIYTRKESGEVADVKTARLVYTVRDGKIVRYELENLDESEVTGAPVH
jgi:hypothetical protein